MSCTATSTLAALLALAGAALAGPDAPGVDVQFRPWQCPRCVEQGRVDDEDRELKFMGGSPDEVARKVGLKKRRWFVIESPHVKIFSALKRARVKHSGSRFVTDDLRRLKEIFPALSLGAQATGLRAHQRAHLYQLRLERVYAEFAALTGNRKPFLGMPGRYEIYLFDKEKHVRAYVEKYVGRPNESKAIDHHDQATGVFCVTAAERSFKAGGDRQLNQAVVHMFTHTLVNGTGNFFNDTWGWIEEGLAHYYGRRETESYNYFCGAPPPSMLVRGSWNKKLHYAVSRGKDRFFGEWCEKLQPQQIAGLEHAMAWSIVKWLIETDPVRFAKLVEMANDHEKKPTSAQAIEKVFGVTPDVLHERWREYILKRGKRK